MNLLAEKIAAEMAIPGALSFERFMELALYCPNYGYYEREGDNIGARGDFYTSVSVGSLFGEMLGWQFAEWLEEEKLQTPSSKPQESSKLQGLKAGERQGVGRAEGVQIVEAGAHDGKLARDILRWLRTRRPGLFEGLQYWIVEPSARRRGWQEKTLAEFGGKLNWVAALGELRCAGGASGKGGTPAGVRGVIFCNELLDALPVQRWGWDAQAQHWFEWGVTVKEGKFEWARLASPVQSLKSQVEPEAAAGEKAIPNLQFEMLQRAGQALGEILPDGFTVETNEAAAAWWQEAAGVLERGRLVTLDYGLTEEELLIPERKAGTLRAYRHHQVSGDVLADPGEQDLTAHVNFTRIREAGEAAGLRTEVLTSQERFLTGIAARIWQEPARFGEWTQATTRQFQTLTHPEHLGRAFRVLVQARQSAGGGR